MSYERIQFSGTIRAVVPKQSRSGAAYWTMSVEVQRDASRVWYNVLFLNTLARADVMAQYQEGQFVFVEATPRFRAYGNKEGEPTVAMDVVANVMPTINGHCERIQVIGRIGDVREKTSKREVKYIQISVAVNRGNGETVWYNVLLYGGLAASTLVQKYRKGQKVQVEAKPRIGAWKNAHGEMTLANDIIATSMPEMLD